jgi:hypothetical protein
MVYLKVLLTSEATLGSNDALQKQAWEVIAGLEGVCWQLLSCKPKKDGERYILEVALGEEGVKQHREKHNTTAGGGLYKPVLRWADYELIQPDEQVDPGELPSAAEIHLRGPQDEQWLEAFYEGRKQQGQQKPGDEQDLGDQGPEGNLYPPCVPKGLRMKLTAFLRWQLQGVAGVDWGILTSPFEVPSYLSAVRHAAKGLHIQ